MLLQHPTLGHLRGCEFHLTVQYRNLPYARFNGRFKESSLGKGPLSSQDTEYDATQWGPLCPQISDGIKLDFALAGVELPHAERGYMSEEGGLNAVVTVPKTIANGKLLPILVWIHGGYWVVGGNSWQQYDLQNLVDLSAKRGKPIIGVAFNYRLGVLGLLASKELDSPGNFGLKDQVLGFQWLQNHIVGFGGDPSNITVFGESAGAMLLSALLQLSTPLFHKAMVMSGNAALRPSKTKGQQEKLYDDIINALGLEGKSPEKRKNELRTMQYKEMIDKLPPLIHVGPSIEARFLDDVVDLSILPRKTCPGWCSEIVIGDCFHDATCFKTRILSRPNNAEYFIECINYALAREQAESVIHAYKLSPSDPPEKSLVHCIELLTDLRWYLPILHTDFGRKSMSPKVSRYHFHQLNRFDCQWHGLAAHLFDITLLLQNHRHVLSKDEIKLGEDMADRVLGLAYGDGFISQHENNGDEDKVVVWGPHGNTKLLTREEYDATMRQGRGKLLLKLGAEVCEKLADTIQFGIAQ